MTRIYFLIACHTDTAIAPGRPPHHGDRMRGPVGLCTVVPHFPGVCEAALGWMWNDHRRVLSFPSADSSRR